MKALSVKPKATRVPRPSRVISTRLSAARSRAVLNRVSRSLCEWVNTPRALAVWLLLEDGSIDAFKQIKNLPEAFLPDHRVYFTGHAIREIRNNYFVSKVFSKLDDSFSPLPQGFTREAAVDEWIRCERRNRETNDLFRGRSDGKFQFTSDVESMLHTSRRKIASILGSFSFDEVLINCRQGKRADLDLSSTAACNYNKYATPSSITEPCRSFVSDLATNWSHATVYSMYASVAPGNKLAFVNKNMWTMRAVCTEPRENMLYQLGAGEVISDRLSCATGIHIPSQDIQNRRMAKSAFNKRLATVDLKSASNLLSYGLMLDQLPIGWFNALDSLRSSATQVPGLSQPYSCEMFSSMGNGFTFPLQTTIFYSLAYAACSHVGCSAEEVNVFGDDIILPNEACESFFWLLSSVGLEVNRSKTFVEGNFHESCGHDYFYDVNIRPYFIKSKLSNANQLMDLAQGLLEFASHPYCGRSDIDWARAVSCELQLDVPPSCRLLGPPGSTGCFPATFEEVAEATVSLEHVLPQGGRVSLEVPMLTRYKRSHGYASFQIRCLTPLTPKVQAKDPHVRLVSSLLGIVPDERGSDLGTYSVPADDLIKDQGRCSVSMMTVFSW